MSAPLQKFKELPPSEKTPVVPAKRIPLSFAPEYARAYLELMRLDKPTGTWLVFWPFAWGLTMAAYRTHLSPMLYSFELTKAFLCAFLMRSFACTVNDIADYSYDSRVERTKTRPLASGRVTYGRASLFAVVQMINATGTFYLIFDRRAFVAAMIQLLPLSCIYPLLKRVTHWPQAWLGLAINFGAVVSWLQVEGTADYALLITTLASLWCWTILYDTIYACQDKADDIKIGVRSTALLFGTYIRPLLTLFGLVFAGSLACAGYVNHHGAAFFAVSLGGTVIHLLWQFATVDLDSPHSCRLNFVRNGQLGWIVWGGLVLDYLISVTPFLQLST